MRLLNLIDRYITKKFLATFFVAILLMIAIILVFDFSEKVGQFMEKEIPVKSIIFDYYLSLVPYYVNMFMSLFVFISIIFFTSKMAGQSEIIAILSSGTSFFRLLKPYMFTAFLLFILSFTLGNFIIPYVNINRIEFQNKYITYRPTKDTRNVHKQIQPGIFVYMKFYDVNSDIGHIFTIEHFEDNKLVSKLYADNIFWNETKQTWRANNYWIRNFKALKDDFEKGVTIDTNLFITPKDIKETDVNIETLNFFQLNTFIEEQRLHGNDSLNDFLLVKHRRTALPFSTFILTFIAVAMSSKKVRGGTGLNIGIGIVLSFVYIMIQKLSDQWAINGSMTPFLAVWTPNFIFLVISVFLYRFAPK